MKITESQLRNIISKTIKESLNNQVNENSLEIIKTITQQMKEHETRKKLISDCILSLKKIKFKHEAEKEVVNKAIQYLSILEKYY